MRNVDLMPSKIGREPVIICGLTQSEFVKSLALCIPIAMLLSFILSFFLYKMIGGSPRFIIGATLILSIGILFAFYYFCGKFIPGIKADKPANYYIILINAFFEDARYFFTGQRGRLIRRSGSWSIKRRQRK